jgi:hypothetical protein
MIAAFIANVELPKIRRQETAVEKAAKIAESSPAFPLARRTPASTGGEFQYNVGTEVPLVPQAPTTQSDPFSPRNMIKRMENENARRMLVNAPPAEQNLVTPIETTEEYVGRHLAAPSEEEMGYPLVAGAHRAATSHRAEIDSSDYQGDIPMNPTEMLQEQYRHVASVPVDNIPTSHRA